MNADVTDLSRYSRDDFILITHDWFGFPDLPDTGHTRDEHQPDNFRDGVV